MAGVKVKFDGDKTQLEQAYRDLAASHARLENQVAKLGQTSQKAAKDQQQGQAGANAAVKAGADQVRQLAASWLSLEGVIAAASGEMEEFNRIRQDGLRENVSVGQSQSKLMFNLAGSPAAERSQFMEELLKIQKDQSFPDVKQLYDAASSALAASGGNTKQALDIVRAVAPLARNAPTEASSLALGAATMQEILSSSAEEAIGFMSTVGGPAYIADPSQQAQYIPNTIKGMMETSSAKGTVEGRRKEAQVMGSYVAAAGTVAGDKEGRASRTEGIDFATDLERAFREGYEQTLSGGRKIRKKLAPVDPGTFEGRVEYLRNNEKARKLFEENETNEKEFMIARREYLRKGGITYRKAEEFKPQIRADKADYDSLVQSQATGSEQLKFATEDARQKAREQQNKLNRPDHALDAMAVDIREKALADTRRYGQAPYFFKYMSEKAMTGASDALGYDPLQSSIDALETRRSQIRSRRGILGGVDMLSSPLTDSELSNRQRQDLKRIEDDLEQLRRLQRESTAGQRDAAGNGNAASNAIVQAINNQTKVVEEQSKLSKEQTQELRELSRDLKQRRPWGNPQDEVGRHRER